MAKEKVVLTVEEKAAARAAKKAARKANRKGFGEEFKTFICRGNVVDMAVGVVVGSAFTAIVNSLVSDIITPVIGYAMKGVDFSNLKIVLDEESETFIKYGVFIEKIFNFLLVAFVIFLVVKFINKLRDGSANLVGKLKKKEDEAAPEEPAPEEAPEPAPAEPAAPAADAETLKVLNEILAAIKEKNS